MYLWTMLFFDVMCSINAVLRYYTCQFMFFVFLLSIRPLLNRMDKISQTGIHLSLIQHRFVKRKILPHHPLQPKSPCRVLRSLLTHSHPESFIRQQIEDHPCHRPGIPYRHQEPCPSLHDLLRDAADRARHDRGAAGQGLEDGGREGVGPGGVEVEVSGLIVPCDLFEVFLVGDEPDRDVADLFRR